MRAASWLVDALADDVYGLCRAMVRDPTVAEDLAQDAFGRALSGLSGFRGEASPRTWLLAIARNRCRDHLRRQRIQPDRPSEEEVPEDHADPAPSEVSRVLCRSDVERGLMVLSETERALVVLRHGHGLSYAELAQAFGIREGTARMRVSRALKRMRVVLEEGDVCRSGSVAPSPASPKRRRASGPVMPFAGITGGTYDAFDSMSVDEDDELDTLSFGDSLARPLPSGPPAERESVAAEPPPAAPNLRRRAPASLRARLVHLLP